MKQQAAANNRNVTELDNVQQISAGIRLGMTPSGNSIIQSTNQPINLNQIKSWGGNQSDKHVTMTILKYST